MDRLQNEPALVQMRSIPSRTNLPVLCCFPRQRCRVRQPFRVGRMACTMYHLQNDTGPSLMRGVCLTAAPISRARNMNNICALKTVKTLLATSAQCPAQHVRAVHTQSLRRPLPAARLSTPQYGWPCLSSYGTRYGRCQRSSLKTSPFSVHRFAISRDVARREHTGICASTYECVEPVAASASPPPSASPAPERVIPAIVQTPAASPQTPTFLMTLLTPGGIGMAR